MKKIRALACFLVVCMMVAGCTDSAVKEAEKKIQAIALAADDERYGAVTAAIAAYDALTDEQKEKITNAGDLLIEKAVRAIDGIGYLSDLMVLRPLTSESKIAAAQNAYNALSDEQKEKVTNAAELTEAQRLLQNAKDAKNKAQTFGEKVFLKLANCFKYPESVQLQHAWYYTLGGTLHYYTFQFDVKNGLGITENVYYGTKLPFMEMTDDELSQWISGFRILGDGNYFAEGEVDAMDNTQDGSGMGVELDAQAMQRYFQNNR